MTAAPSHSAGAPFRLVVFDVESTCWSEKDGSKRESEIIEIGAVRLDVPDLVLLDEFDHFIRPLLNPILSPFCTTLTGIQQAQVDGAPLFPEVFQCFADWAGGGDEFWLLSWGVYDLKQIKADCALHGIALPANLRGHTNLKRPFASLFGTSTRVGLRKALATAGLRFEGRHHRGIDDARNAASLTRLLEPVLWQTLQSDG